MAGGQNRVFAPKPSLRSQQRQQYSYCLVVVSGRGVEGEVCFVVISLSFLLSGGS